MSLFGKYGRFANQLFQYSFLHIYAKQHGLDVQIPPWVGTHLFGLNDPPVSASLDAAIEKDEGAQGLPPVGAEFVNKDWRGYAQFHTSWYRPYVEMIQSYFQPVQSLKDRLTPALERLQSRGETRIGLHFRRGDYGRSIFYITPEEWYLRWLKENWSRFNKPVLFIATEDPSLATKFSDYNPVMVEDLGLELQTKPLADCCYFTPDLKSGDPRAMDFYPDFWMLSQCEVMLIPNSTFSFAAAMLNTNLKELWQSNLPIGDFHRIDPWDSVPLDFDKAEDYRHLPGVCLDETKYWKRLANGEYRETSSSHIARGPTLPDNEPKDK